MNNYVTTIFQSTNITIFQTNLNAWLLVNSKKVIQINFNHVSKNVGTTQYICSITHYPL